jgi:hypothetical protein
MTRVVGPITGFLFVVNCDSGRRSRRTFMPGYDRFPRKLEEFEISEECKPAWAYGMCQSNGVDDLILTDRVE